MFRMCPRVVARRVDGARIVRIPVVLAATATLLLAGWVIATPGSSQATATGSSSTSSQFPATDNSSATWIGIAGTNDGAGYWVASNQGSVKSFGNALPHGDTTGTTLNQPIVGMAATPDGGGYWLDASDGGIFAFGNARFWGSTGSLHLNKPVVGMARSRDGGGYWLVAADGGIFSFGDATFEGSMGSQRLNEPIVGMAPTHDGRGYWLIASDGGIFAFGDAAFLGSLGSYAPKSPIVNMTPTPDNNGYWLVSQNGTVYPFGDAGHKGSLQGWSSSVTSIASASTNGYWILTSDGVVHPFGDAGAGSSNQATSTTISSQAPAGSANSGVSLTGTSSSVGVLSPSSGTAGGGETVQITGSGFTGALNVLFGSNASSDFTVNSPTSISAIAPAGEGTVDVRVQMENGTTTSTAADQFTYVPTGQLPITAQGQNLEIGGVPTKFTGFNAYQLATSWGTNAGCGGMASSAQINEFFSSLRPNSLVRFWAFQGTIATTGNASLGNVRTDWQPLDNIFYAAAKYRVYLIPAISDQGGGCDGEHWQDIPWYSGGFKNVYNSATGFYGSGLDPLSYWDYMNALVSRYADSPALGMWEPMSEAEASTCPVADEPLNCGGNQTCPDEAAAAAALKYFFTTVGAQIHLLDANHLVEAGFLGGGQCGTSGPDYESVGASSGIDVLSVHDYYGSAPLGGDQWNGMAVRFVQAKALDKPIITGEAGIAAGVDQSGCESLEQRALDVSAKMSAQFSAGDSGFLIWNWDPLPLGPCSYNSGPYDPSLLSSIDSPPGG